MKTTTTTPEFSRGYVTMLMILDGVMTLIGLGVWAFPFADHFYPGGYNTMLHVTFGAMIATLAAFRVLLAYRSAWVEYVLFVLGFFVLMLPTWLHMRWDAAYNTGHMVAGAIVMVFALISAILTLMQPKPKYE